MASLVIGSKFRPFSYSEMLAPIEAATTEHRAIEEGLGEMSAKAGMWDKLANQQSDPVAYAQYKTYADDLTKQADLLARQGLTPESRRGLLDMKRRYSNEITPIEVAATKREELTKAQREAIQKDPSLMFNIDYGTASLDDLINNPNATYNTISGSELSKRASMMASNLAKTIQENPQYQSILGGQYFQQMQQLGYSPQQVMQTIMNDPNAPKELKQVADTIWQESGLDTWDQATQARARDYINAGLYDAIGTQRYDTQANRGYMSPMETERASMMKDQFEWQKKKWEEDRLGIELPDGSRIKDVGNGKVRITYPDGRFELRNAPKAESNSELKPSASMKAPQDVRAIVADKAGGSWVADLEGTDNTGWYNWVDFSRSTRDWGSDARVPNSDKLQQVAFEEVPREVLSKIVNKMESNVDPKLYNFYKVKGSKLGYIAVPKMVDSAPQSNAEPTYNNSVTPATDSLSVIKSNLIAD